MFDFIHNIFGAATTHYHAARNCGDGSVRYKRILQKTRAFMKRFSKRGQRVVDFEYTNYKRVLQMDRKKKWLPRKFKPAVFFKKLYRLDDQGREDFGVLLDDAQSAPTQPPQPLGTTARLQTEYATTVLHPHTFYSVDIPNGAENPADDQVDVDQRMFFLVLAFRSAQHHAKVVEAVDRSARGPSLHIQHCDPWNCSGREDRVTVFLDTEPQWMHPLDICPFVRLETCLYRWDDSPSDANCCFDLRSPRHATPTMALTDVRCPSLTLVQHLTRTLGFKPYAGVIKHVAVGALEFDGRKPFASKSYFQCLAIMDQILTTSGPFQSGQPQAYYKVLLLGGVVAPHLGADAYRSKLRFFEGWRL
jgi:hypothetical protein